jgi:DNA-binding CsgD family transcriptional regulator
MAAITLTTSDQRALHAVLTAEPVPGDPLPSRKLLQSIAALVPCDGITAVLVDNQGRVLRQVGLDLPEDVPGSGRAHPAGPFSVGVMHWSAHPLAAQACGALVGLVDGVAVGFRHGPDHLVQIGLRRARVPFSSRDLTLVHLLAPVLQRLVRERPAPGLAAALTVAERRVLMHVAAGRSNDEIAQSLFIAPSTVRKHLEHTFRKLGVSSRLAAVARLQGRDLPDLDLRARLSRLA